MNDILHTIKIGRINFSESKIKKYKKNMLDSETLKTVAEYYKSWWPKSIKKLEKNSVTSLQ